MMQKEAQKETSGKKTLREPLENTAWRNFSDTYKRVYSYIMSDLRQYGLTPPQYSVLRAIGRSPSGRVPMSEIGKEMVVTFANITTIVDNLERRYYVRRLRDTKDRRVVKVELTKSGSTLFRRIYRSHRRQVWKVMKVLDSNELRDLIDYTDRIRGNMRLRSQTSKKSRQ